MTANVSPISLKAMESLAEIDKVGKWANHHNFGEAIMRVGEIAQLMMKEKEYTKMPTRQADTSGSALFAKKRVSSVHVLTDRAGVACSSHRWTQVVGVKQLSPR